MSRDKARSEVLWVQYRVLSWIWVALDRLGFEQESQRVFEVAANCWESGYEYKIGA